MKRLSLWILVFALMVWVIPASAAVRKCANSGLRGSQNTKLSFLGMRIKRVGTRRRDYSSN